MSRTFTGIDPGVNGAIVTITEDRTIKSVHVMPTFKMRYGKTKKAKLRKVIDLPALERLLKFCDITMLEKVHAMKGVAAGSTFNFGKNCGYLEGILTAKKKDYILATP